MITKITFYIFLFCSFEKCSYLQHAIQVKHCVKHCAKLHTKEAWRIRMQKLCNLLTNFALCFDRAHKEKRCPFKTDSITLFREGGPWTNEAMSWAAVGFPSGLLCARSVHGEGCRDWDQLTPHSQATELLLCTLSSSGDFFPPFSLPKLDKWTFLIFKLSLHRAPLVALQIQQSKYFSKLVW